VNEFFHKSMQNKLSIPSAEALVYARFVPNLTRKVGSAFERLLLQFGTIQQGGKGSCGQ
jgi:hypothetical protein